MLRASGGAAGRRGHGGRVLPAVEPGRPGAAQRPVEAGGLLVGRADRGAAGVGVLAAAGPVHDVQHRVLHAAAEARGPRPGGRRQAEGCHRAATPRTCARAGLTRVAGTLLRLLALAATVQFVSAAATVLVSTVAWQAAGRAGMLPGWMGWYGTGPPGGGWPWPWPRSPRWSRRCGGSASRPPASTRPDQHRRSEPNASGR